MPHKAVTPASHRRQQQQQGEEEEGEEEAGEEEEEEQAAHDHQQGLSEEALMQLVWCCACSWSLAYALGLNHS